MGNINSVLKEVVKENKLSKNELAEMQKITKTTISDLNNLIKKAKIKAQVFVGGSFAKNTVIKKQKYDIDIFIRFSKTYKENELSKLLEKIIKNLKNYKIKKIHGSRDYYNISHKEKQNLYFEIVPVIQIQKPEESRNVTDLSYFHVNYITKQIKSNSNLADEIIIFKTFCYANNCYGAESYIKGFSGYALELLMCKYKTFLNFIKQISKIKLNQETKIIVDIKKYYKNKNEILYNINESKLQSPIIFIDPTYKYRNALAALSLETLIKFQSISKKFLKSPNKKYFEKKELNIEQLKKYSIAKKAQFLEVKITTNKQAGDIAGSKLLKFNNFLQNYLKKHYDVLKNEFQYNENQEAIIYIVGKPKKQIIIQGPPINSIENLKKFKKKNKNAFIKNKTAYAKITPKKNIKKFLDNLKQKHKSTLKEMSITSMNF